MVDSLARGGFGRTPVAEDVNHELRPCLLKQLKPFTNPRIYRLIQDRLEREAAILGELGEESSGRIPNLYDSFSENGLFYLVQERIEGETLRQKIEKPGTT